MHLQISLFFNVCKYYHTVLNTIDFFNQYDVYNPISNNAYEFSSLILNAI